MEFTYEQIRAISQGAVRSAKMELQSRIFEYARRDIPGIRIYACDVRSIIKSLGELVPWKAFHRRLLEYNELLAEYSAKHDDFTLLQHIISPLFFENRHDVGDYEKVRKDIFIEGQVNFNQKGCTVDGAHPNDLGFACMANAFGKAISRMI